jgi:nucleotide-binding universal stress UspA family protein
MQIKHIVVPTDFSPVASNALAFAVELAKRHKAHIHLVHVYEVPYASVASDAGTLTGVVDGRLHSEIKQEIHSRMEQLSAGDLFKGITVSYKLMADIPVWQFAEKLEGQPCDLIVMGTTGHSGILHGGLVGTNTERVIRTAHCPVLTVPNEAVPSKVRRIAFASDFEQPIEGNYKLVSSFAKLLGAELDIAVINTRDNYNTTRKAQQHFEKLQADHPDDTPNCYIFNDDDVETGILNLVGNKHIDLVAMLTHGRTGVARLFRGSIAEGVSREIHVPLLTFKQQG